MDLKEIVQNLRSEKNLKGRHAVVVKIPSNMGGICHKKGFYVMTYTQDKALYFHGLSRFRMVYKPENDFAINLESFEKYSYMQYGKKLRQITLFNGEDFLPIHFFCNIKSSYEGECNAVSITKRFDELGLEEVNNQLKENGDENE